MTSEKWLRDTAKMHEIQNLVSAWDFHKISPTDAIEAIKRKLSKNGN